MATTEQERTDEERVPHGPRLCQSRGAVGAAVHTGERAIPRRLLNAKPWYLDGHQPINEVGAVDRDASPTGHAYCGACNVKMATLGAWVPRGVKDPRIEAAEAAYLATEGDLEARLGAAAAAYAPLARTADGKKVGRRVAPRRR